jgi:hypothetical protein
MAKRQRDVALKFLDTESTVAKKQQRVDEGDAVHDSVEGFLDETFTELEDCGSDIDDLVLERLEADSSSSSSSSAPSSSAVLEEYSRLHSLQMSARSKAHLEEVKYGEVISRRNRKRRGQVILAIDPLSLDDYEKLKMSHFSLTITFPSIKIPQQYQTGGFLFACDEAKRLHVALDKLFSVGTEPGDEVGFRAFLKVGDSKSVPTRDPFASIKKSKFLYKLEVQPSNGALHVQASMKIKYQAGGFYFLMDLAEIKANFERLGFEPPYINASFVQTNSFDCDQYVHVPNELKKNSNFESMKEQWKKRTSVATKDTTVTKGTFDKKALYSRK